MVRTSMLVNTCAECEDLGQMCITPYKSYVCTRCGVEDFGKILCNDVSSSAYTLPLQVPAVYTRIKRFKKYLLRACRTQSTSTIPKNTWDYLLAGMPYRAPHNIIRRLKKAPKTVGKKCYDSLPLLVQLLCPHLKVPMLTEREKMNCVAAFRKLDSAYCAGEPFVSYLFALEYILEYIKRHDMLPFINKISCRRRRENYRRRLNKIFTTNTR